MSFGDVDPRTGTPTKSEEFRLDMSDKAQLEKLKDCFAEDCLGFGLSCSIAKESNSEEGSLAKMMHKALKINLTAANEVLSSGLVEIIYENGRIKDIILKNKERDIEVFFKKSK